MEASTSIETVIRVLPYGNTDYDFLHIEERRNLGASHYFFSYRRIFGAVNLPNETSSSLVEKAGREGFRDNRAYRQFRSILENFFVQLAADFFRDNDRMGAQFVQARQSLNKQVKAREQQARRSGQRRRELAAALDARGSMLANDEPIQMSQAVIRRFVEQLEAAKTIIEAGDQIKSILGAEDAARQEIHHIREQFHVPQPKGVGLPLTLRRNLDAYSTEYAKLEQDVFRPALIEIEDVFGEMVKEMDANVDRQRRLEEGLQSSTRLARSAALSQEREARSRLHETTETVRASIREAMTGLESELSEVAQRVQRANITALSDSDVVQLRMDIDSNIETIALEKRGVLESITVQLEAITAVLDGSVGPFSQIEVTEAMEEELLALQERAETDLELTQLGMAIGIIDHEFQATIRSIRSNLRRLKAWGDVNVQLSDLYNGLRVNFDHLDSYLTMFTPLHRRLYRTETEIKGSEIAKFVFDLFKERFERHRIDARTTQSFRNLRLRGYPSTFYPVFVNLVDNAIFWLATRPYPRTIRLDAEGDAMLVLDNGPGVLPQDRDAIFEMGFTRKPGGRGLGLYISRDVLSRVGFDLTIDELLDRQGAVFRIQPKKERDD